MIKRISVFIVIIILLSINLVAQITDSLTVNQIDDFIFEQENIADLKNLHEDGILQKKRFLGFKKVTGSFYTNIIYSDTIIFSIENVYSHKKIITQNLKNSTIKITN
ncbi:MAG: hypothetical protein JXR51_00375 [Bacteroidales bacterium]|nr:hypothetical protein [Bacteroidales bacterium]